MIVMRFKDIPSVSIECSVPEAAELIKYLLNGPISPASSPPIIVDVPNTWKDFIVSLRPLLPTVFSSTDVINIAMSNMPPKSCRTPFVFNTSSIIRSLRELTEAGVLKRTGTRKYYKYMWR